ncbi:TPA: DUF6804 family protein [Legionella pneumophila]
MLFMNNKFKIIWLAPICMLLLSLLHWPYGFYFLLRIFVTGCAAYLAYKEYSHTNPMLPFVILMTFIAILFNPVIPIYFSKSVWSILDSLSALVFGLHFNMRNKSLKKMRY